MSQPFLPQDVARCSGIYSHTPETDDWLPACKSCLRRTAHQGDWQPWMAPPIDRSTGLCTGRLVTAPDGGYAYAWSVAESV